MWIALGCVPFLRGAKTFSHSLDPERTSGLEKTPFVMVRCLSSKSWPRGPERPAASPANSPSASSIPADDPGRVLTVADPDGAGVPHISVAGGTYTILVSGAQTGGRYCLVDMLVPAGGGPPPHRHDFEEMFTLLEGELEFTFRGKSHTGRAGSTVNVPAEGRASPPPKPTLEQMAEKGKLIAALLPKYRTEMVTM